MTTVINMLGGSGIGKSTTAAGLYHAMKSAGYNVELVREYVKNWAWDGKKVGQYDQIYIFGKQARSEYMLYGKVDYIVTDSPILLSPVYEKFYNDGDSMIETAAVKFLRKAENNGITHLNFVLNRTKEFISRGRYETEEQAKQIDAEVINFLNENNVDYYSLSCDDSERIVNIMKVVKHYEKNR
jgi:thymidylate kinase